MERWMESLPFPLASVLWRYHADQDVVRKCEYLVHFFEATTVFLVDVHVSALQRDPQLLASAARRGSRDVSYTRGSIGIWADLLARLASRARALTTLEPALAKDLFQVSDLDRLRGLTRKAVVSALKDDAAMYRRDWIGHAAVVGPEEWQRRLVQAEGTLATLRLEMGDIFQGWANSSAPDVARTAAESLRPRSSASSDHGASSDKQMWNCASGRKRTACICWRLTQTCSLRLRPLFTMQRSPESVEDACYFYDRIQADGIRWISYHYEPRPQVVRPDAELVDLIGELDRLG